MNSPQPGNLGQLLFRCARLLNDRATDRMQALGSPGLRPVQLSLLTLIDLDGTRLTELARRMKVSKQAVGQQVDELQQQGLLQRSRDPHDRRAWRVAFTDSGRQALLHGLGVLAALQQEAEHQLGPDRVHRLLEDLDSLREWLSGNFSLRSR